MPRMGLARKRRCENRINKAGNMPHREERQFVIHLHLFAEFADDYEGDEDGFAWHRHFEQELRPRLVRAVFDALRAEPSWVATAAPRGRDPAETLDIVVERQQRRRPVM
jgi:hypothetical protein